MVSDRKKRGLTGWEKTAVAVIVILVVIIMVLVFREQLEEYIRTFLEWYGNER